MSNLAQEEVARLFSQDNHLQTHPEDRNNSDGDSVDEKDTTEAAFAADPNQDTDDEDDLADRMANLTTTKSTYILPATEQYANTGPKGVIADAQSFTRAKRTAYRYPILTTTNIAYTDDKANTITQQREPGSGSEEEEDDEFMAEWRAKRLAELAADDEADRHLRVSHAQQRRVSPSRRTYGSAMRVDAHGYLDAIEKVSSDTSVVVMIYDEESTQSQEVEDEVDIMAYKYGYVRFVKLDHEIAEMTHIQIPAILVYKNTEVQVTISGAKREGLEKVLSEQGVFN